MLVVVESATSKSARTAIASGWLGTTFSGGIESAIEQQHALKNGVDFAGGAGRLDLPQQQAVLSCTVVVRAVCKDNRQHQPDGSASTKAQTQTRGGAKALLMF